jgi:hypothetical protein
MKKIILAIEILEDWVKYMPDLIQYAQSTSSAIHIFEFAAPLGTGMFTSNIPSPEPEAAKLFEATTSLDPNLTPADTLRVALQTTEFVETIATYLRANKLEVTTAWLPNFDQMQLGEYALANSADAVALIQQGWWAKLLNGDPHSVLQQQGLSTIDLKPSSLTPAEQIALSNLAKVHGETAN